MIDIIFEADDVVVKFPKQLVSSAYVQDFLERLRLENLIQKSQLTEEQAWQLTEEIKEAWWQKNKEGFLQRANS